MHDQELAILYSGGTDSLALYAMAAMGNHALLGKPPRIHLLHMLNGMGRFADFPRRRFEVAQQVLQAQFPQNGRFPVSEMIELDMGRLFQGLWLDHYETMMPKYNGKNLVCVACKVGMHCRAILYCVDQLVPVLVTGYAKRQGYYPEQTPVFMGKLADFSQQFGITTKFPVYDDFVDERYTRHVLEDLGLPSTGGGERKCLFCQTLTTATEVEIGSYLDDMLPVAAEYIEQRRSGKVRAAADCFPPGRSPSA